MAVLNPQRVEKRFADLEARVLALELVEQLAVAPPKHTDELRLKPADEAHDEPKPKRRATRRR